MGLSSHLETHFPTESSAKTLKGHTETHVLLIEYEYSRVGKIGQVRTHLNLNGSMKKPFGHEETQVLVVSSAYRFPEEQFSIQVEVEYSK